MKIGVPKEIKIDEYRVGLVPAGVADLKEFGHEVYVEQSAGIGCRIKDEEFANAGAMILDSAGKIYEIADMIIKVKEPLPQEYDLLKETQIIYAYLHLAPSVELTQVLLRKKVIAVAYETIQLSNGALPLLVPMSEVAGKMGVQIGAHFLEINQGGRGVLLGGVPGVSRGRVTIIGGGTAGNASAMVASGMGADVTIVDSDQRRLSYLDDIYGPRVTTLISNKQNIQQAIKAAHLVIGAVLIPGARAPKIVTRDMISQMQAGTVVVDISIDQGGCFETSKPTSHRNPTYLVDEVIHYCVPNIPGIVARTSTYALTNLTLPYALKLANMRFKDAVRSDPALARGVNCYKGLLTHENVARGVNREYVPLETAMEEKGR